jgi:3D (Asp-Asp-Asp) domain-containing protein
MLTAISLGLGWFQATEVTTAKHKVTYRTIYHKVTAYCLRGRTASGVYTHWGSAAVSRSQYRMGQRFYIPKYGWARAEDTGSAVGYGHIDVWLPSCGAARSWGVRYLPVRVF